MRARPLRCAQTSPTGNKAFAGQPNSTQETCRSPPDAVCGNPNRPSAHCLIVQPGHRPLMPRVVRSGEHAVTVTLAGLARWKAMSTPRSRRFPVTVTHLPITRCQLCDRTLAYWLDNIGEVLTDPFPRHHALGIGVPIP